jgi:predicted O-linked N-acetylglucosamine transferase (SPINDLY family)
MPPNLESKSTADQALEQARALWKKGNLKQALPVYTEIIKSERQHIEANLDLGKLHLQQQQAGKAAPHLQTALIGLYTARRYAEAEQTARLYTSQFPQQAFGWKVLGSVTKLLGNKQGALELMQQAARLDPADPEIQANLGNTFRDLRCHDEALASYRQAITLLEALMGQHDEQGNRLATLNRSHEAAARFRQAQALRQMHLATLINLNATLREARRLEDIEANCRNTLSLYPDSSEAHNSLGLALRELRRPAEAQACFEAALAIKPDFAEAHGNLGNVLKDQGRLEEAAAILGKGLQIQPDSPDLHNNLGVVLHDLGRLADAEQSYRRTLQLNAGHSGALNNLGVVLQKMGRAQEAVACYSQALQAEPDWPELHNGLGAALDDLGRKTEAEACYRKALQLDPGYAKAYSNLGATLHEVGRLDEALACYTRALELRPGDADSLVNLGNTQMSMGLFDEAVRSLELAQQAKPDIALAQDNLLFALNYHPDRTAQEIFAAYQTYDQRFGQPHRAAWWPHSNDRNADRRLRVGYVSPDFRLHSCRHFLEPLLAHHDKKSVEVYCYAELSFEDATSQRYKQYADHWVPTKHLDDDALAQRIRDDGIDILVDIAGHTRGNRLPVFARKPAPVSASWLGFGYTTGLSAIDYFITDGYATPAGCEALFSESLWRLDRPAFAYRPAPDMGEPAPLPALHNGHVTFSTLTRAIRVNHQTIRVWSQLLKSVAHSRLIVNSSDFSSSQMQEDLARQFEQHGIAPERLIIGHSSPPWDLLRKTDITLDCFPHNSGTTLFESLYMGVPFVTLAGRASVGCMGSAILHGTGYPEWIARDEAQYVAIAAGLASDLPRLGSIRAGLRDSLRNGPLMAEADFARRMEAAYQSMWAGYLARERPALAPRPTATGPSQQDMETLAGLFNQQRNAEAFSLAQAMVRDHPHHGFGWKTLGGLLRRAGQLEQALAAMNSAARLAPEDPQVHNNLGNLLVQLGRPADAIASCLRAITLAPQSAEAPNSLGNAYLELGQLKEAEASYRRALALDPNHTHAHCNLGGVLVDLGRVGEAEAHCHKALALAPDLALAHNNLGIVLNRQGLHEQAVTSLARALQLNAGFAPTHNNLGIALSELGRHGEALAAFQRALELNPNLAQAYCNRGNTLRQLGRFDEAIASLEHSLRLRPAVANTFDSLLFTLNYHPDKSAQQIYSAYQAYDEQVGRPLARPAPQAPSSAPVRSRLKVGYVSPDFRRHSCQYFLEPLLAHHDKKTVEVYAYADLARPDEVSERYKQLVAHWVDTIALSDEELTARILADGIDVLVDLAGHTRNNRLPVFARKPAPVSVSWLGFGYTTGLQAIDYYLTDWHAVPRGHEAVFSETPWRLDRPAFAYLPAPGIGPVGELPALRNGYVTFGSLSRRVRINHHTVRVWSRILQRIPNSRIALDSHDFASAEVRDEVIGQFAAQGIAANRLVVDYHSPPWDTLDGVDIALDCFPHNSGTTLFECLYKGLPFVTLAARPGVGRIGSAILHGVGHPEWIADSEEDYVAIAVKLAQDLGKLAGTRSRLRGELQAGALMDAPGFARAVEDAYRGMQAEKLNLVPTPPSHARKIPHESSPFPTTESLVALFQQKRFEELLAAARALTERAPQEPMGWSALGVAARHFNRLDEALVSFERAHHLNPTDAETLTNMGVVLKQLGRLEQAELAYRTALQHQPAHADAHNNLGRVLKDMGRPAEAITCYQRAIALRPSHADAHNNLGLALYDAGRTEEARTCYQRALAANHQHAEAHTNLGVLLCDLDQVDEAISCHQTALRINPAFAQAHNNLGIALSKLGRHDEARDSYRNALAAMPEFAEAASNLGNALRDLGEFDNAVASFRGALHMLPGLTHAFDNLLFTLNYHPDIGGAELFAAYRDYETAVGHPHRAHWKEPAPRDADGRRLRIGYVSPDFRYHSCRFFVEPLVAHHNRDAVELFAYAELVKEDAMSLRYKAYFDHWVSTRGLSDQELADRIRADGIDVLVDIAGHTVGNRLPVFARKPAPVSVSWLGFGYTTGLRAIDYFLTDHVAVPLEANALYSETPWRLDGPGFVYQAPPDTGPVGALPAMANGHITFGTLTRSVRINHKTVRVWSEVLRRVAKSKLVVNSADYGSPAMQDRLRRMFQNHGIAPERLVIGHQTPPWDVMRGIDITLDCFPHNSGTTLFESLYMGVPFVTLAGRASMGRLGSSILHGIGLTEWIAQTESEYVDKAVALAEDQPGLASLRSNLRARMENSPLTDAAGFTLRVETAYRQMWQRWIGKN